MSRRTKFAAWIGAFVCLFVGCGPDDSSGDDASDDAADDASDDDSGADDSSDDDDVGEVQPEPDGVCSPDGWCWEHPVPGGDALNGVSVASDGTVFAVGDRGMLLRYDGSRWRGLVGWGAEAFRAVWAAAPNDAFAVGDAGRVARFRDGAWAEIRSRASGSLVDVWGSSVSDVYAVGAEGIWHYDGTAWTLVYADRQWFSAVWGSSPGDVFAAGYDFVVHFDGNSWSVMSAPGGFHGDGLWGASADDVFAVGYESAAFHYDGIGWSARGDGLPGFLDLHDVWGTSGNDVYAAGDSFLAFGSVHRFDGTSWSKLVEVESFPLNAIDGLRGGDVWAVGWPILRRHGEEWENRREVAAHGMTRAAVGPDGTAFASAWWGTLLRRDEDARWSVVAAGVGWGTIQDLWGRSADDVYAVAEYSTGRSTSTVAHFDGTAWTSIGRWPDTELTGIWGTATELFAVGERIVVHYDGSSWTTMTTAVGSLNAVWGASASDVFAVEGNRSIYHYDGNAWTQMIDGWMSEELYGVWGASGSDVFAVGTNGTVLHYDGSEWSALDAGTTAALFAVWGLSGTSVFVAGDDGLHYYDGARWMAFDMGGRIEDVWGSSGTNIVVADGFRTLRFDGTTWHEERHDRYLREVWTSSPSATFVGGDDGQIYRFNGIAWADQHADENVEPHGIWVTSATDVHVVGTGGTILHYDGAHLVREPAWTANDLNGIWRAPGGPFFVVGDGGTILRSVGEIWLPMSGGTTGDLMDVWGTAREDVFAVGQTVWNQAYESVVLHFDGSEWVRMESAPNIGRVEAVWGTSPTNVYIGGADGVWRYDGAGWSRVDAVRNGFVYDIGGSSATDVYVAGNDFSFDAPQGFIAHYDGETWTMMHPGSLVMRGVAATADGAFAVGDFYTIVRRARGE